MPKMGVDYEAFSQGGLRTTARYAESTKTSIHTDLQRYPGKCFCEGCRKYKPGPEKRNKGWRCADCKTASIKMVAVPATSCEEPLPAVAAKGDLVASLSPRR